jgi:hypothetical protein
VSKIGIEKAQHTLIMVLIGEHKPLKHKELGLEKKNYDTWLDVTNVFEI